MHTNSTHLQKYSDPWNETQDYEQAGPKVKLIKYLFGWKCKHVKDKAKDDSEEWEDGASDNGS